MPSVAAHSLESASQDAHARLDGALEALGLDPAEGVAEIANLLESYGERSTLSSLYRYLMLERFGSTDVPSINSAYLNRTELIAILVRMAALDGVTAYTVQEVARGLEVTEDDVRALMDGGELWWFGDGERLLMPSWQFVEEGSSQRLCTISEHLPFVLRAIPPGAPPALVRGVMTLDDPSLPTRPERPISPRQYLMNGGAPYPVIATLLRHLEGSEGRVVDFLWGTA